MRIIVAGSRTWDNVAWVEQVLKPYLFPDEVTKYVNKHGKPPPDWMTPVIVHGDCPNGADRIARNIARFFAQEEPHPANWEKYGKSAGHRRNILMVDLGADICLVFLKPCDKIDCPDRGRHWSHGSSHTIMLCKVAGIPVRAFASKKDKLQIEAAK